jgi:hypothetical protein
MMFIFYVISCLFLLVSEFRFNQYSKVLFDFLHVHMIKYQSTAQKMEIFAELVRIPNNPESIFFFFFFLKLDQHLEKFQLLRYDFSGTPDSNICA